MSSNTNQKISLALFHRARSMSTCFMFILVLPVQYIAQQINTISVKIDGQGTFIQNQLAAIGEQEKISHLQSQPHNTSSKTLATLVNQLNALISQFKHVQ